MPAPAVPFHPAAAPAMPDSSAPPRVPMPTPAELTEILPHGRYLAEQVIGQGGMGMVYRGTQVSLNRAVAIKLMKCGTGGHYAFEDRFRREAQSMAQLNHPNIVTIFDYGYIGKDFHFLVMEYIDGTDVAEIMRTGGMTPQLAMMLLPQICHALEYAHGRGIVHRDIKPANIMITRQGEVKVADFGLAKKIDQFNSFITHTNMIMGTPEYAAPEQIDAHREVDHRADIYSLGVMIYQMLMGQLPRGAWQPPSSKAGIDPRLDNVVVRALMPDRNQRFQSVAELRLALEAATARPVTGELAPGSAASASSGRPSTMSLARRVLLLEDDLLVRDIMRRNLELSGLQVVETGDGRETLHLYREALKENRPYDLVILDLTIPEGLGGAETMQLLLQMDPKVVAVVSSGYRDDPIMNNPHQYGFAAALPKPYQREGLLQLVNAVLAVDGRR